MRRLPLLLLLLLALTGAGCAAQQSDSSDEFTGPDAEVATAIEDLETAASTGDEEEVCGDRLTPQFAARVKARQLTCSTLLSDALDEVDSFDLEVTDVRSRGTSAEADVTAGSGDAEEKAVFELIRGRAGWRVNAIR